MTCLSLTRFARAFLCAMTSANGSIRTLPPE